MKPLFTTLLFCTSFSLMAATPTQTPAKTQPAATTKPSQVVTHGLPLNQYGAIDVNASVPMSAQVPPVPKTLKLPKISTEIAQWPDAIPTQPMLNVRSYMLMDANSGKILVNYNGNKRIAPASLTKLMLLYIAQKELAKGRLHLTDKVLVPRVAWATGGSRMFLKPGTSVTVRQLISGIIVDSGNDAAVTLATDIAGSQNAFVSMMNHEAKRLGMTNTHFSDVMGLPAPKHYSSARDLLILARAIVTQYPQYASWFSQKSYTYNNIKQYNFNKLLFMYPYADGLKTGSTQEAGFSLVSTAKMPNNPMRLIAVVIGAPTDRASATDSKALLTYGFRFFKSDLIYPAGKIISRPKVYMGAEKTVPVGVTKALYATYPTNVEKALQAKLELPKQLHAPIEKGQAIGKVVVTLDGKTLTTHSATAMQSVKEGNLWQRMTGKVASWF